MKKWAVVIGIVVGVGLAVWLYMEWSMQRYVIQTDFYDFVVPKAATLTALDEKSAQYEWEAATFEHGLPRSYQYALKQNGWQQLDAIDTIQVYEKEGRQMQIVTATDYLAITKETASQPVSEISDADWGIYMQALRRYVYVRTQAVIHQDITRLWNEYPQLQKGQDVDIGINAEQQEVDWLNGHRNMVDANFDLEAYDHIKMKQVAEQQVIIQVHGSIVYMDDDFEESGGEYLLDISLENQEGTWQVVKTDAYTDAEYKDWIKDKGDTR